MAEKAVLIDTSLCTGCRGCQVACKQWWQLSAEETWDTEKYPVGETYSYQNPPELSHVTWSLVRFNEETKEDGKIVWRFSKDQCRHCAEPPCQSACPVPGVIIKDESGGVYYNVEKCGECNKECATYCPFDIPKFDGDIRRAFKCRFCIDRVTDGESTLCAKACPTGAIKFGDKADLLSLAKSRVNKLKEEKDLVTGDYLYPNANLYPGEEYNAFWVLLEDHGKYSLAKEDKA
ncbi:MAG: 4Fe-4S dicluster domain-containing protein, partial [Deltaproteobacteria bacterium]